MKFHRVYIILGLALVIFGSPLILAGDNLSKIKKEYAAAEVIKLEMNIIVISSVFEDADTVMAEIVISGDGRYLAKINDDIYLFDGTCNWEYSFENAQVTKRCLKKGEIVENELFFIKDLDRFYSTTVIEKDKTYKLIRVENSKGTLPDSLTLSLDSMNISIIEYYDLNDDLNRINIISDTIFDKIDDSLFHFSLPDSVEVITLP